MHIVYADQAGAASQGHERFAKRPTGAMCERAGRDQGVDVVVQHALSRAPPPASMRALRSAAKSWSGS